MWLSFQKLRCTIVSCVIILRPLLCILGVRRLVHLHPLNLHLHRQLVGMCPAHPAVSELHVNEQVEGGAEGVLPLLVRLDVACMLQS